MSNPALQPRPDEPVVELRTGRVTRAWADYFMRLALQQSSDDLRSLYEQLAARVAELEEGEQADFRILGQQSISVSGVVQPGGVVIISLENDTDEAGNTAYYGTGPDGVRGWFPLSGTNLVVNGELTKVVGLDGVSTFGLADVANSGSGALQAITRDAKGRVTGTRAATITGTAQQINVANGTAAAGLPTLSLAAEVVTSLGRADSALQAVQSGTGITVDNTDPRRPVVSATGGTGAVSSVNARTGAVAVPDYVSKATAPGAADYGRAIIDGDRWFNSTNGFTYTRVGGTWLAEAGSGLTPPKAYIDGFKMIWNSATSLTIESGTAYIESLGMNIGLDAAVTKIVPALTANAFYHLYVFTSSGVSDVEISATAPAAPYNGTARSKTGDSSRRYIGSILASASGGVRRFVQSDTEVSYLDTLGTVPYRILAAGSATTPTAVSVLPAAPITAVQFKGQLINNVSTGFFVISAPGGMLEIISVAASTRVVQYLPIFNSQMFYYNTAAGGSSFIDLHAYVFER